MKNQWFARIFSSRYAILFHLLAFYLVAAQLVRLFLLLLSLQDVSWNLGEIAKPFVLGAGYDLFVGLCLVQVYNVYLLLLPSRFTGSKPDRIFTYTYLFLALFMAFFSLLAEFPFWEEFQTRFNFIAVDYLVYTYEVIGNINESYPIPLLIAGMVLLIVLTCYVWKKQLVFRSAFGDRLSVRRRLVYFLPVLLVCCVSGFLLNNRIADHGPHKVNNELAKNGVFSFLAAFRSNELDYHTFYRQLPDRNAYRLVKQSLLQQNQHYADSAWNSITRETNDTAEIRPNIIVVTIESFSADFLSAFGNTQNITPFYDSLANRSVFFTNLFATGTRTVRGIEALTLSVPPTPGNSIVRRPDNSQLASVASILGDKGYHRFFLYGGDGYFDNMNTFFGAQGFDIIDRDRGNPLPEHIATVRHQIPDEEVRFENAWGICDEDLYGQSLKYADAWSRKGKPFFQFIMTTSNHKPFTFPEGKIDLPQGDRNGAVRYTDYALEHFLQQAQVKPWFANTVFLVVADHCASSAGKWEINVSQHHIPAIFYNLPGHPVKKEKRLVSQIDLLPTLFGYLGWNYKTQLYGRDINELPPGSERAFIGNYRTLGLLQNNRFTQLDDRKGVKQFTVDSNYAMAAVKQINPSLSDLTIAFYQTASERFASGKMKLMNH